MGEKLSWNYVAQAVNGPSLSAAGEMEVDAYDKLAITVADNASQQVDLVPNAKASLLIINPENASADLTYKVGAYDIKLDGPQVFIGAGAVALLGGANGPTRVQSFAEFERRFGGRWRDSSMSYAVQQFFQNGGTDALIVRVHNGAAAATLTLAAGFNLVAANPGKWGEKLRVRIDHNTRPPLPTDPPNSLFNLSVRDTATGVTERFLNLSTDPY